MGPMPDERSRLARRIYRCAHLRPLFTMSELAGSL